MVEVLLAANATFLDGIDQMRIAAVVLIEKQNQRC